MGLADDLKKPLAKEEAAALLEENEMPSVAAILTVVDEELLAGAVEEILENRNAALYIGARYLHTLQE